MLTVNLIAVGKLKEGWMRDGLGEYAKRLAGYCRFTVTELEEFRLPENPAPAQIAKGLEAEGDSILAAVGKAELIALCIEGTALTSPQLAEELGKLSQTASRICLVIGGSYGLCDRVKQRARLRLSLSKMTFPHQLFRVMLAEQLYRAFSIAAGGKYHK
ncbi:MAG: 23S rRNA (pseudouridine(1915)-N(3))-methyltransferase RlmH [Angelakisella sp.]